MISDFLIFCVWYAFDRIVQFCMSCIVCFKNTYPIVDFVISSHGKIIASSMVISQIKLVSLIKSLLWMVNYLNYYFIIKWILIMKWIDDWISVFIWCYVYSESIMRQKNYYDNLFHFFLLKWKTFIQQFSLDITNL